MPPTSGSRTRLIIAEDHSNQQLPTRDPHRRRIKILANISRHPGRCLLQSRSSLARATKRSSSFTIAMSAALEGWCALQSRQSPQRLKTAQRAIRKSPRNKNIGTSHVAWPSAFSVGASFRFPTFPRPAALGETKQVMSPCLSISNVRYQVARGGPRLSRYGRRKVSISA